MRISHVQPMPLAISPLLLVNIRNREKPKREVPQLSQQDLAIFAHIEQKAKTMTIDDLMKAMGIN